MFRAENPEFSETEVTFSVKDQLGWDDANRFPAAVYIEHDCDMAISYEVSGRVFYDRAHVRYLPERTCRVEVDRRKLSQTQTAVVKSCSGCGFKFGVEKENTLPFEVTLNVVVPPSYCPNCGAKVEEER